MQFVIDEWPWGKPFPKGSGRSKGWWDKSIGFHIYSAPALPRELRPYHCKDFSLGRWYEDEINNAFMPVTPSQTQYTPKDHQNEGADAIIRAYRNNERGFLEADCTGLGKTLTILSAVSRIAESESYGRRPEEKARVLIVCPKSVIAHWRQTIRSYSKALAFTHPMIVNYQKLGKLLKEESATEKSYRATGGTKSSRSKARKTVKRKKSAKRANRDLARKGVPRTDWDFIIFDEAHLLKNYPTSNTSLAAVSLARLEQKYTPKQDGYHARTPFVIYSTATPGASPLNLSVMSGIIAPHMNSGSKGETSSASSSGASANRLASSTSRSRTSASRGQSFTTPSKWGQFLADHGFAVSRSDKGEWSWATVPWWGKTSKDPAERARYLKAEKQVKVRQRKDSMAIGRALKNPGAPFIRRSPKDIAGWPEQQVIPFPISMTPEQGKIYETVWSRFRKFLNLAPSSRDPKTALVERLRYKQKSTLLKVDEMVSFVAEQVTYGSQVFIACEFMETIDRYKEMLEAQRISVTEISGRVTGADREESRLRFQKGEAKVVLCTVPEGISLHAGETLPDGTKATSAPRITILHDIRDNNVTNDQILGRAHRDGQNSITYVPYLEDTVDMKVIDSYVNKRSNMNQMTGDDDAEAYERIFRQAALSSGK